MQNNRIDELIKKAKILYSLGRPLTNEEIMTAESSLGVIFSDDLKKINLRYSYEFLDFFDFYGLCDEVINQTLALRESWNLPQEYVVLSEDDVSMLLLKTISAEKSEIIWCDEPDFFNLCEGKPMVYNPTIFSSFTDFFEFLLDEEEKMQAEDD